ncbi:MAG: ATP-binding protein [candidate division Zixibacteria bacterium]|nr:ATP-binding protein [candidate division Zixibacteria bacterium]
MSTHRDIKYLKSLVNELRNLSRETEWVEFKHNNDNPDEIGEYISSLSNSATLHGKAYAYLLWGIDDMTHDIIGTTFSPDTKKVGEEELENWLLRLISPKINFHFFEIPIERKKLIMLEIPRAFRHPVQFKSIEYIRIGSYQKKLKNFPEKERELWRIFDDTPFEDLIAVENLASDEVIKVLDYPAYFDLLEQPLPETREGILDILASDSMIVKNDAGMWNITNLGAILLAKKLSDFRTLKRKAVRVVLYQGESRVKTVKEQEGGKGYACGFEGLISFINSLLPSNEIIEQAIRKTVFMYPELAIRELVANAVIHQDFFITGSGPLIEIFDNRMEITNPGASLVETARFLDSPPRSRNDALASFMRRIGVCEERGSGVDKVVFQIELHQLPAPIFEVVGDNTRVVLFAHRELRNMDKNDRVRACYLHACLKFVNRDYMTNASLRDRFGIDPKNSAIASRFIREATEANMIKPYDEEASRKYMKYVPYWA